MYRITEQSVNCQNYWQLLIITKNVLICSDWVCPDLFYIPGALVILSVSSSEKLFDDSYFYP